LHCLCSYTVFEIDLMLNDKDLDAMLQTKVKPAPVIVDAVNSAREITFNAAIHHHEQEEYDPTQWESVSAAHLGWMVELALAYSFRDSHSVCVTSEELCTAFYLAWQKPVVCEDRKKELEKFFLAAVENSQKEREWAHSMLNKGPGMYEISHKGPPEQVPECEIQAMDTEDIHKTNQEKKKMIKKEVEQQFGYKNSWLIFMAEKCRTWTQVIHKCFG
jgi:hypothetical protein